MVIPRRSTAPALAAGLLFLLALLTTSGDVGQASTAWVDVVLILLGGAAVGALALSGGGPEPTLGLFLAVAVMSGLSIAWSVAPDQSWEEAGRTLAYVGAFAAAVALARHSGGVSTRAIVGLTTGAVALCAWSLLVKVLDLGLYGQPSYGRLTGVFAYWNATGLLGAIALPGCVWISARRQGPAILRGLAAAGITIASCVVVLSLSRSALAAAALGTAAPIVLLRARRRAVVMLALGLLGGAPAWIDALSEPNLAHDGAGSIYGATQVLHRGPAELMLGLILLVCVVGVTVLATAGVLRTRRHPVSARVARLLDRSLLLGVLAVPVLIVAWLLLNARGPGGEISHLWHQLTGVAPAGLNDQAARLGSVSNSHAAYWRQALSVGEHHLLAGAGVGTFFPAHLGYATAILTPHGSDPHHAHSYVLDTFASLGLIGVALNLALFGSWWRDVIASLRGRRALDPAEFDARCALVGVVVAFGVSSALDWTWFFPGVTVPALFAAGWISGVGRLRRPLLPAAAPTPSGAPGLDDAVLPEPPPPTGPASSGPVWTRPGALLALTLIGAVSLAAAWESLQPMLANTNIQASQNAQVAAALAQASGRHRLALTDERTALDDARAGVSDDPLSVAALARLGTVLGAVGDPAGEQAALTKATQIQPDNPQPFALLGGFFVCSGNYEAAIAPLHRALMLDITDSDSQHELFAAVTSQTRPSLLCGSAG